MGRGKREVEGDDEEKKARLCRWTLGENFGFRSCSRGLVCKRPLGRCQRFCAGTLQLGIPIPRCCLCLRAPCMFGGL